ncbi:MAG: 2-phospho-L-lactate guanylyltransferase [Actinomycetota bacterium]|nr:2-phospho-L-lactate guanylyltransferase [Actinomycetota bacterium]
MLWTAIVPVKASAFAKSRLNHDQEIRARLSAAFLSDVLTAAMQATAIDEVIVVTDDHSLHLRLDPAVRIHLTTAKGLNPELAEGLQLIGHKPAAIIAADLPCLTVEALEVTLLLAQDFDRSFVTDAQGLGTTMLFAKDARTCVPMFGRRSHARHAQAGFQEIQADSPATAALLNRARRDVDTALDLWDAVRIGVGPSSTAAMQEMQ